MNNCGDVAVELVVGRAFMGAVRLGGVQVKVMVAVVFCGILGYMAV